MLKTLASMKKQRVEGCKREDQIKLFLALGIPGVSWPEEMGENLSSLLLSHQRQRSQVCPQSPGLWCSVNSVTKRASPGYFYL